MSGEWELIVTQWDVNKGTLESVVGIVPELIVTQWDVNEEREAAAVAAAIELIVTQWDVNNETAEVVTRETVN